MANSGNQNRPPGPGPTPADFRFSQVPNRLVYNPPRKEDFPPRSSNWRHGLKNILSSVDSNNNQQTDNNAIVLFKNEKYVCTYDMYPKAKYHVLLMRRTNKLHIGDNNNNNLSRINTLNDLEPTHLHQLREFHTLGRNIASRLKEFHDDDEKNQTSNNDNDNNDNNVSSSQPPHPITMKIGYHAIPSFEPLHLHILSSDLDSPCITKRDHIVSFISPLFFVELEALERHLENAFVVDLVKLSVRKERARSVKESTVMTCTRCGREAVSVPDWKRHNHTCSVVISSSISADEGTGKLNSLLGWVRKVDSEKEYGGRSEPTRSTNLVNKKSRKRRAAAEPGNV